MYQWHEDRHVEQASTNNEINFEGGETEMVTRNAHPHYAYARGNVHYAYARGWYSRPINSRNFAQPDGHENPDNQWPFFGDSWQAKRLDIENMKLDTNRGLEKLGKKDYIILLEKFKAIATYETEE